MRSLRPALLLLAVLACAWFAIGVRQSHEVDEASTVITAAHQSAVQLRAADSELRAAAFLNPDRQVDILRGRVAIDEHRLVRARRILGSVTRAEPLNLEGQIWFTGANLGLPAARRGTARIVALDPLDARAVGR